MGDARSWGDDGTSPGSEQLEFPAPRGGPPRHVTAFLFADIRDYTGFTDRHGAEAAAELVSAFLSLARDAADTHRGQLRGTWGDQVLIEFDSPRDAVRAAAQLQQRCIEATLANPALPLLVGVGLDIGEAAVSTDGTSGSGLNVAARLCAKAGPGEVLATDQLAHTAGVVDGQTYVDHGRMRLKGLSVPTRVVLVRPAELDREQERQFRSAVTQFRDERQDHRLRRWIAALTAAAVVAGLAAWGIGRLVRDDPVVIPAGGVAVVDAGSGRLVDAVPLGGAPSGVAVDAEGAVWVARAGDGTLAQIDTERRRVVATDSVGRAAVAVVATGRDIWMVNGTDRFVHRINTTANREVDKIEVGNQPVALAAGEGAVWVTNKIDGTLQRINPVSGKVTGTAPVGRGPDGLVVSDGTVWVANGRDGTVSPVDARSLQVEAPIPVGAGPRGMAATGGGVWVANSLELSVSHIDTRSHSVTTLRVGESPSAAAVAGGSVWVSVSGAGTLVRIDPEHERVIDRIYLGATPYGVAAVYGNLWVATRPFASPAHFGGTLRVAGACCGSIDPAIGDTPPSWLSVVYDGLVTLQKAAGSDGYDLVPDLAQSLPAATDGGSAYTFRVRRGIRYSDGQYVHPEDFRRGMARQFTATTGPDGGGDVFNYTGIVGGQHCLDHPDSCDLSEGITTGRDTVTFHLTAPDPDFLNKLTEGVLVAPAPPGSPSGPAPLEHPLPGTGPYAISVATAGEVLLTRNRYFHQWSLAAQPRGYPDRIRFLANSGSDGVQKVLDGTVDATDLGSQVPAAVLRQLRLTHPDLVHENSFTFTWMLQLNTKEPPFDSVTARQALAYAVDRREFDGPSRAGGDLACELPPPGFPGFAQRCTYTANPDASGLWHGPDFDRARRLVVQSGTKGAPVDVWWWDRVPDEGRYLTRLLQDLGYHARLHLEDGAHFFGGMSDPGTHKNVTANGWNAGFPAASTYIGPLLSCNGDHSMYCNRAVDRLADSALAAQDQNPGLAERLWRQVFATVDADAAAIPLIHGQMSMLVSERVGNYESSALMGPLFSQMWVQ